MTVISVFMDIRLSSVPAQCSSGADVAVRQHGEVPGRGEHRVGRELQVHGELGEGFAIDDHGASWPL